MIGRTAIALLLLLASFIAARAEPPACTGTDLLGSLQSERPDEHAALLSVADSVPYGRGLLWRIDKPGQSEPSWLFGTIHLTDPRVHRIAPAVERALESARIVVVESLEALSPKEAAKHLFKVAHLMVLPGEQRLDTILDEPSLALVRRHFHREKHGFDSILKLRPYVAALSLSIPACEAARQQAGLLSLDAALAERAERRQKRLAGLETLDEQLGVLASLPLDAQITFLVETVRMAPALADVTETTVRIYLSGNTGLLAVWSDRLPGRDPGAAKSWAQFQDALIVKRNRLMAERLGALLEAGAAFIAVGALHLPGEEGLLSLLAGQGYRVQSIH
jgi:uncharacterized protein